MRKHWLRGTPGEEMSLARVVVLGAGVSGHTAALHLRRLLSDQHEVVVVTPNSQWNWIPSNIWVGVGRMRSDEVLFPLAKVYRQKDRVCAGSRQSRSTRRATDDDPHPAVDVVHTSARREGPENERLRYDHLINATGPKPELPGHARDRADGNSPSQCARRATPPGLRRRCSRRSRGALRPAQTLVMGMGHGTCTCEGAAFEYAFNFDHELRQAACPPPRRPRLPHQRERAG